MSYTNEIGSLQQALTSISLPNAKPTSGTGDVAGESIGHNVIETPTKADHTSLSSAGGLMAQALEVSDTRSTKIAELQKSIVDGTYNVSSADVADKLISSLLGE